MINSNDWYSVQDISKLKIMPVLDTDHKIKRFIDMGLLKGNSIGQGNGKRYFVKGNAIIQFVAKWEDGSFHS